MAKKHYNTKYPKMLRKKARKMGVDISNKTYRFIDDFMRMNHQLLKTCKINIVIEEAVKVVMTVGTNVDYKIKIVICDGDCVGYIVSNIASFNEMAVDEIRSIVLSNTLLCEDYLALQLKILPSEEYDRYILQVKGRPWLKLKDKNTVRETTWYLYMFMFEVTEMLSKIL